MISHLLAFHIFQGLQSLLHNANDLSSASLHTMAAGPGNRRKLESLTDITTTQWVIQRAGHPSKTETEFLGRLTLQATNYFNDAIHAQTNNCFTYVSFNSYSDTGTIKALKVTQ